MLQREYPLAPLVGVGAVIVKEGLVLLVKRGTEPAKGRWSIPGGLIDVGESLHEAVAREVLEETGLIVEPLELIELLDRIHRDGARVRYHYVIADYLCRVKGGTLLAASDADAVRWIDRAEWTSSEAQAGKKNSGLGASSSELEIEPVTARIIEAGWRRARELQAQTGEKL